MSGADIGCTHCTHYGKRHMNGGVCHCGCARYDSPWIAVVRGPETHDINERFAMSDPVRRAVAVRKEGKIAFNVTAEFEVYGLPEHVEKLKRKIEKELKLQFGSTLKGVVS